MPRCRRPYRAVSDFDGPYDRPYGGAPPAPPPGYNYGAYGAGPGPALLPPQEVYAVLRDNGFSPLGVPHQRGFVYTIAVIDRSGEDGRLVIDARNGRIIRFVPAWGQGPYQGPYQGPSKAARMAAISRPSGCPATGRRWPCRRQA